MLIEGASTQSAYRHEWGRVSALTGIPTLMGWPNHQGQWRGDTYDAAAGTRLQDVEKFYNTTDWQEVQNIIKRYNITFIYVGPTERANYTQTGVAKFETLPALCRFGNVAVYAADAVGKVAPPATGK